MAKYATKKRMGSPYSTIDNPDYGGALKPTTPDIKKHSGKVAPTKFQRDNAAADAKFNRGATTNEQTRLRSRGQKPAKSKGTCDVAGSQPSKRIGRGPGYDKSKGYAKR